jgi:capsular exopolysaccharide synthesis family protein
MSRIHEALKRAEQLRTVPLEVPPPPVPDLHGHDTESPVIAASPIAASAAPQEILDPLAHTEINPKGRAADFLRFDDIWTQCAAPGWRLDLERNVFVDLAAPAAVREQFRTLRSRLYQIRDKQPLRSVLVTSSLPGEGKTFVANNLAHALARQQNCRVLLIDADLRRPDLHSGFGAPTSPGLAEYLKGEVSELMVIQRGLPEYLCLVAGGAKSQNPAELIANGRLKSLLDTIGPVFDWVIVDSPPTLPVSDALMLAELCDGVLTVVRAAQTGFDSAQKSCQQLREKNLLGVALNCADEGASYGSYYSEELQAGIAK